MLVVRARVATFAAGAWLDGLIASTTVAALGVAFHLVPLLDDGAGAVVALFVTMVYPLGDLLLCSSRA